MLILRKNCPSINKRRKVGYIQASWRTNCKLVYYEKALGDDKLYTVDEFAFEFV
jgi:hypothetical protein